MDLTGFMNNSPMLKSQANNILALQNSLNFTSSHQDLSSYPIIGSQLFSGVNGTAGIINPALCQNPNFISSSLPELSGIKSEKSIEGSPDHSLASSIKYEPHTPRCNKGSNEDAEGVWSPDIEKAFQEALQAYPPCGRRKIILTDEGKMYGRNELIARYIREKTGKSRTRKQVSSHIQVLARKKSKEIQQQSKDSDARNQILQRYSSMSSAQIVNEDLKEKAIKRSRDSPPGSGLYYHKSDVPIKTECKTSPGNLSGQPPGIPTSGLNNMPFIKSEDGKLDFVHQIMNTTQASLNGYFPTSLQNVAFPPRTLSSIVDGSFGITRTTRPHPHVGSMETSRTSPATGAAATAPELRLKMLKFNGYMERTDRSWRHYFIDLNTETDFSDPNMERIDIEKIHDKFREFPSGEGSLKELFEAGPSSAFFLVKFWVDLNMPNSDPKASDIFYGHDNKYESKEKLHIKVSTKACSFGKGVVEKLQSVSPVAVDGRLIYDVEKSPLCEYMVSFIYKLKDLPDTKLMNNVLENFTVLQHVTDMETSETLLCVACVFEVSETSQSQYSIYRLVGQ
ncbi:hypothetical protein ACHWQZ_G009081 [Mnemiopsis leidyi]